MPIRILERAIFIPRDLDAEGRKYPKIGDLLMKRLVVQGKGRRKGNGEGDGVKTGGYEDNLFYRVKVKE